MRVVTFIDRHASDASATIGALIDEQVVSLARVAPNMLGLIAMGTAGLEDAARVVAETAAADRIPLAKVRLLAPIPRPHKNIMCLGQNYAAHARESMRARGLPEKLPEHPVIFTKAVTTVNDPDGGIVLDPHVTQSLD